MTTRRSLFLTAKAALFFTALTASSMVLAQTNYTWIQDTDNAGNWDDPAQWLDGVSNTTFPNAVNATVLINQPIWTGTGLYTLTMPATDVTVGQITLDNTGFSNTTRTTFANGGGQLIFQSSSGTAKYIETANTGTAPANTQNQKLIIDTAARHRLPAIYPFEYYARNGGLVAYVIDLEEQFRLAAAYADRILRGARPAELPVQQPTKYQLIINRRTARALDLVVPAALLARADEVIE